MHHFVTAMCTRTIAYIAIYWFVHKHVMIAWIKSNEKCFRPTIHLNHPIRWRFCTSHDRSDDVHVRNCDLAWSLYFCHNDTTQFYIIWFMSSYLICGTVLGGRYQICLPWVAWGKSALLSTHNMVAWDVALPQIQVQIRGSCGMFFKNVLKSQGHCRLDSG